MPPAKTHRSSSSSALRSHSRSSSSSKLAAAANLQLTTKDYAPQKTTDKAKKGPHDVHARIPRTHSTSRLELKEQSATKRAPAPPTKAHSSKLKGGFTINLDDDEDDDAWVSSESGADTPNRYNESDTDSDSDVTSTAATPVVRESAMRAPQIAKRSLSSGSTKRQHLARVDTIKQADIKKIATTAERKSGSQQQRVSQLGTKGPPSPISPVSQPPSHLVPEHQQSSPRTSPDQMRSTSGANGTAAQPSLSQPPHLTAEQGQALRQQAHVREAEKRRTDRERESTEADFQLVQKVNGAPINTRLPAPGVFLESQSRGGSRPATMRSYADCRLMEPTAAARFAEAIAAQDQDPRVIAAALSKPSSPNIREHRIHSSPHRTELKMTASDDIDHRGPNPAVVSSEPVDKTSGERSPRSKRHSRPSSIYSVSSGKHLRPHPLIKGQSHGGGAVLQPLTVKPDSAKAQLSTSSSPNDDMPPSPLSTSTTSSNIPSPSHQDRRSSVSSTRSVATLPSPVATRDNIRGSRTDRSRTLSTISSSSTIAALSSLVQHPIAPSQRISFFPHTDEEDVRKIHPLPPVTLTSSHLQYVARRSPLRESYDRLMRAKAGR